MYRGRLFGSSFHARVSDAGWRAGVTLWLKSWDKVPAGTLPDDEVDLCRLAELGRDIKEWRKVAKEALHGWFKCSDERLHHRTVAEGVLEAWQRKTSQRERTEAARLAKVAKRKSQVPKSDPTQSVTGSVTEPATELVTDSATADATGSKGQGQGYTSVLTDGPADPEPAGPPFRSVLDQPLLRVISGQSEPKAPTDPSGAERDLFVRAKEVAGATFGGQVPKLIRAKGGNIALARAAVETASTKHNAREYLNRVIRGDDTGMPPGQLYDRSI